MNMDEIREDYQLLRKALKAMYETIESHKTQVEIYAPLYSDECEIIATFDIPNYDIEYWIKCTKSTHSITSAEAPDFSRGQLTRSSRNSEMPSPHS